MTREIKFRAWTGKNMQLVEKPRDFAWLGENAIGGGLPVMQSTGLRDKNGVEIFEGDLVECYSKSGELVYTYPHEVKIPDFYQEIWSYNEYGMPAKIGDKTVVKIVGNIYEHPHLLPDTKETRV